MLLITPSLLNSFRYYFSYEGENEIDVRNDFLRTLSRQPSQPNEAMQKGIDFENRVQSYCNGVGIETGSAKQIGDIVKGGLWQYALKKPLGDFLLYARADVIKADTIYDIKTAKTYDLGKYQGSMQHRIEFYCSDLPKFQYLVASSTNDDDWWIEEYINHDKIENEIAFAIHELTEYLKNDKEASDLFYSKWGSK
jgi:hypothetical protein